MIRRVESVCLLLLLLLALIVLAGCESPGARQSLFSGGWWSKESEQKKEEQCRIEFQTRRSRPAMRWLLAHRIEAGMSRQEVERVLGENGELEQNSMWLKKGGQYRVDDQAYGFGPDERGERVYLFFRDGNLVNYEPREYADRA